MGGTASGTGWRSARLWGAGSAAIADLIARAPHEAIAPLLSLSGGLLGGQTVGLLTTWLLLGVVFYLFAPLAYSLNDVIPRESTSVRLIFAAGGVALGAVLSAFGDTPAVALGIFVLGVGLAGGGLLLHLHWFEGWHLLDPHGRLSEAIELFSPHEDARSEIGTDLGRTGVLGAIGSVIYLIASAMLLGFPVGLAGFLAQVFIHAYPIPDLLLLGWVLGAAVTSRVSLGPSEDRVVTLKFDFERYVVDALENGTRSIQGVMQSIIILLGMIVAARYLFIAVRLIPTLSTAMGEAVQVVSGGELSVLVPLWNTAGIVVLLLFAGGFALWAWIREWQRLAHFLDRWENRETAGEEPISRPPGFLLFPTVVVAVVAGLASQDVSLSTGSMVGYAFGIAWPALIAVGGLLVRWTFDRPPQPLEYEHYWNAVGLFLLSSPSLLLLTDVRFGSIVLGLLCLGCITGLPVVERYETVAAGTDQYLMVWYLLGWAVLFLLGTRVFPAAYQAVVSLLIGILAIGGLAIGLARRHGL